MRGVVVDYGWKFLFCFFRSTITIFRQRIKPGHDFRVWNELLIRYAGYEREKPDGTREIIGDPASLDFTKVLILNCYPYTSNTTSSCRLACV